MNHWIRTFVFLVMIFLFLEVLNGRKVNGDDRMMFRKLLPNKVVDWVAHGEDKIYNRETIYRYMDGAGDIYLGYDFNKLLVQEYVKESAPPIVAEIYQMTSSGDAYGIFSHDPEGEYLEIGQGAIYSMGLLRFWKDRIFVRLFAEKETMEAKAAILALSKNIASKIPLEGKKPDLLTLLPSQGLINEIIPYFHKKLSLDIHYYLADSNLLNLSENTKAVLARYQIGGRKVRLFLCQYLNAMEARRAYEKFSKTYFFDKTIGKGNFRVEKIERGEYVSIRVMDRLVILVFEAGDKETCEELTKKVEKRAGEVS